jgi:IS6 family transposase
MQWYTHGGDYWSRRLKATGMRSVEGALSTIAGSAAMNIIRKGQIRWLAKGDIVGQARFIGRTLGLPA